MRTVEDHLELIRAWVGERKQYNRSLYGVARFFTERAGYCSAARGGTEDVARARKAARRYRLAAWVLRRLAQGEAERDAAKAKTERMADEARIMALPRLAFRGRG